MTTGAQKPPVRLLKPPVGRSWYTVIQTKSACFGPAGSRLWLAWAAVATTAADREGLVAARLGAMGSREENEDQNQKPASTLTSSKTFCWINTERLKSRGFDLFRIRVRV